MIAIRAVIVDVNPGTRQALVTWLEQRGWTVEAYASLQNLPVDWLARQDVQIAFVRFETARQISTAERLTLEKFVPVAFPVVGLVTAASRTLLALHPQLLLVEKPFPVRDLITAARWALTIRQGADCKLHGSLDEDPLYFLVRCFARLGWSGTFRLRRGNRTAELHLQAGSIVGIRVGRFHNLAQLQTLLQWTEGYYQIELGQPTVESEPIGAIRALKDVEHFSKDIERVAAPMGGLAARFIQNPISVEAKRKKLPAEVIAMLKLYDGNRTFLDILEDSPFKAIDTIRITKKLLSSSVLSLTGAPSGAQPKTLRQWLALDPSLEESLDTDIDLDQLPSLTVSHTNAAVQSVIVDPVLSETQPEPAAARSRGSFNDREEAFFSTSVDPDAVEAIEKD